VLGISEQPESTGRLIGAANCVDCVQEPFVSCEAEYLSPNDDSAVAASSTRFLLAPRKSSLASFLRARCANE
jgi:hypothetical protein